MLIIGFGNRARQGKDSAAHAIKKDYDIMAGFFPTAKVGIFKFATALYQEVNEAIAKFGLVQLLDLIHHNSNGFIDENDWVQPELNAEISDIAPYGKHPKLLQYWGTNYRRAQDPDYWTKKLFASIPNNIQIALITDVRFPNEAQGIKERDGYLVNVQRINEDGFQYVAPDRPADHPSETALDSWNWDAYIKSKNPELTGSLALTTCAYFKRLNDNLESS